jgi:hypothetical protein
MSSTTSFVSGHNGPQTPGHGTLPAAANILYPKGAMVARDANGRAYNPVTSDASGNPIMGTNQATVDNRTNAEMGGLDDSGDVEIDYGVHFFPFTGTTPKTGDKLYAVDNQTLSISSNGGLRGFAGICSEVRTLNGVAKAGVQLGPLNALAQAASSPASQPINVPILSALLAATGAPMAVFANGASTVPGVQVTDSEIASVRWNNDAAPAAIVQTVYLPAPSDPAAPAVLHALVSKTGATLADATSLTVGAFAVAAGSLHDADADFGGASSTCTGDAAAKTMQELTLTLAGTDLLDTGSALTLTIKPTAGTLGTDDFCLHAVWIVR